MASGKLYTYQDNFRAYKALIAAQYSGKKVETDANFVFGKTNKESDFLKKFPLGKVPAFESKEKDSIFESNAIAYYVSNEKLRGESDLDKSRVIQWLSFADAELLPSASAWLFPILGIIHSSKQLIEKAKDELKNSLRVLDGHLLKETFLVGNRISLADIVVSCNLIQLYRHTFDPNYRSAFPNVNRWFTTLINQPEFKSVVGEVHFCEKVAIVEHKKHGFDGKKEKPKKSHPKPKEKELEVAADIGGGGGGDGDDDDDDGMPKEPKSKDPFEAFPRGNFNMDDFKRFYSNNDTDKSVPYFWEKFDKENYSIWFCEYKYPKELTLVFMSCNLMSGMMQRLDKMRKNAFGSMCLFGEDNNSSISGLWFWRGDKLAFELSDDWKVDYESYEWKKLDPDSGETKKLVKEYLEWEGDFDGKKFNQGKIFK